MIRLLLLLALAGAAPLAHAETEPVTAAAPKPADRVVATLTVQVFDRDAAREAAITRANKAGGWFASLTDESVRLRVPVAEARTVIEDLRALGRVIDRGYQVEDLSGQVGDLEARLNGRQQVLSQYMEVLATASPKAVVTVEREISRVITEIEGIQGQLRLLQDQSSYADITVSFAFRDRSAPIRDGSSSFDWLNALNLADLLADFHQGYRSDVHLRGATGLTPEGFAPYKKRGHGVRAVSPDDVLFRIRGWKNKPAADLAFWSEAMETRMKEAGYRVLSTSTIGERTLLELGAANGQQDWTYLVGLSVEGKRITVVEAAGEARHFAERKDQIVAAMSGS